MYVTFFRHIYFQRHSSPPPAGHSHAVRGFAATVPLCALPVELHVMSYTFFIH